MAVHAKDSLGSTSISQILNLFLTVTALETVCAKGLVASKDSQVFDFVHTAAAGVCAVVADEGAVAEQEEVRIGIEQGVAGVASEAVDVPSVTSWLD